ncbi:YidB family protein [Entomobacter blattae]|uniref:DUF937 domain-containing protein n=1 Tax=Entomobacter blattae TaxID=2762277 RepID=A0A7H1NRB5_9PROT|nr:YidB family protein [Entomobacter blattae]QNT78325.1 hypothetical protein JGUZn3_10970 [Entomobacter blattae]
MSNFLGDIFNKVTGAASEKVVNAVVGSFLSGERPEGGEASASSSPDSSSPTSSSNGQIDGVQLLLEQAEKAGLGDKVRSWIGSGENLPITADELRQILSSEQVNHFLSKTGIPANILMPAIAFLLPKAVDNHTNAEGYTAPKEGEG